LAVQREIPGSALVRRVNDFLADAFPAELTQGKLNDRSDE
jgi:hypothetical protein